MHVGRDDGGSKNMKMPHLQLTTPSHFWPLLVFFLLLACSFRFVCVGERGRKRKGRTFPRLATVAVEVTKYTRDTAGTRCVSPSAVEGVPSLEARTSVVRRSLSVVPFGQERRARFASEVSGTSSATNFDGIQVVSHGKTVLRTCFIHLGRSSFMRNSRSYRAGPLNLRNR